MNEPDLAQFLLKLQRVIVSTNGRADLMVALQIGRQVHEGHRSTQWGIEQLEELEQKYNYEMYVQMANRTFVRAQFLFNDPNTTWIRGRITTSYHPGWADPAQPTEPAEPELVLAPFYGLRFFRLRPALGTVSGIGVVEDPTTPLGLYPLASWSHGVADPWAAGWNEAFCGYRYAGDHSRHTCGFHACRGLAGLKLAYGSSNGIDVETAPLAIIEAKGRIELHEKGFRAQQARVIAIAVQDDVKMRHSITRFRRGLEAQRESQNEQLAKFYGVPVLGARGVLLDMYQELLTKEGTGSDS